MAVRELLSCGVPPPERWDRLDDEPMRWFMCFERFRLLGPDRSVLSAANQWRTEKSRNVSTSAPKSWRDRSKLYRWQERAEAWDKHCSDQVAAAAEAERLRILTSGFAQRHERVRVLDELARLLLDEAHTEDKRWLPDVKQIGGGEFAQRVDIVRFNAGLIEQLRSTLEDLAAEMGERVKKRELSGPDGGPIPISIREVVHELPGDDSTDDLEA